MNILQVGPLWENIPPPKYGGTERVVHYLTEGLVENGHEVTLYACGTTKTKAKLKSVYPRPLFRDNIPWWNMMYPLLHITDAFEHEKEYDIIHMHLNQSSDFMALPLCQPFKHKVVFTMHFPYEFNKTWRGNTEVFKKYHDLNYVSISHSQRQGSEHNTNWIDTVYNGVDIHLYHYNPHPKDYFLWLGKFNPDKGTREAVLAAKQAGVKLILAGAVDKLEGEDYQYYLDIKPHIDGRMISLIGEISDTEKNELYGNALGFLNPIQWNEPFGLVMTEAMATGTPVISFKNGAAPEIIEDGKNGFLVNSVDEMVARIHEIQKIDRMSCRKRVEEHFTVKHMVKGYEKVYQQLLST